MRQTSSRSWRQSRHARLPKRRPGSRNALPRQSTRVIWESAKAILEERKQFSPALFSAYLLPLRGSNAAVVTPVEFFRTVIEAKVEQIRLALEDASGRGIAQVEVRGVVLSTVPA